MTTATSPCHYSLAETDQEENSSSTTALPTVLLLRGWTDGPLSHLRSKLYSNEYQCDVIEPNLLMPPWRGLWCLDCNFILMFMLCVGVFLSLCLSIRGFDGFGGHGTSRISAIILLFCFLCFCIRITVAVVTRSSIAHGVDLCLKEMRRRNVVLIVGFSWGAVSKGTYQLCDIQ